LLIFLVLTIVFLLIGEVVSSGMEVFPERTINIIVTWPAGGRTDTWIRALAISMEKYLDVPVIVSNHPGGGGVIGAKVVSQAKADGYTLGAFTIAHFVAEYLLEPPFKKEDYDPVAAFSVAPYALAVSVDSPYNTLKEFMDYVKANPRKVKFGTAGRASEDRLRLDILCKETATEVKLIPYWGDAPAITALLGGEVEAILFAISPLIPYHKSGRIRILAVAAEDRFELVSDIPTFVENGINFTGSTWTGLFAPKGTPESVIQKLSKAIEVATKDPKFKEIMDGLFSPIEYQDSKGLANNVEQTSQWIVETLEELGIKKP